MNLHKFLLVTVFTSLFMFSKAQNPEGFDKMCAQYINVTISIVTAEQLKDSVEKNNDLVILDAREPKEYNVAHLPQAKLFGYNNMNWSLVKSLDREIPIYVYCSIGYRSEKVGEKLKKQGFMKVYNVYGGVFSWANSGFPLIDSTGKFTHAVHGYNKEWAKWVNTEKCTPIVD